MASGLRRFAIAAAVFTAALAATPVMATITIVDANSIQGADVLFTGVQIGAMVTGSTQSGTLINFTGSTTVLGDSSIIRADGGHNRIDGTLNTTTTAPDDTFGLTSLLFQLDSGATFNNLEFDLFGGVDGGRAFFTALDQNGDIFNFGSFDGFALGSGSNFFGFAGIDGQSISFFQIDITPGSIQDVRQIRLDEVAQTGAVPEPGTWAMMLIGFGAIGTGMRRRRRTAQRRPQTA